MHLRDRKLKTCKKLACTQTMGSGIVRALRVSPFTSTGTYHQRTELILLSHIKTISLTASLLFTIYSPKFSS